MGALTPPEFDALTRSDFQIFAERVFAELNPCRIRHRSAETPVLQLASSE